MKEVPNMSKQLCVEELTLTGAAWWDSAAELKAMLVTEKWGTGVRNLIDT